MEFSTSTERILQSGDTASGIMIDLLSPNFSKLIKHIIIMYVCLYV